MRRREPKFDPAIQKPAQPPWGYDPVGPYAVLAVATDTREPFALHVFETLAEACAWWLKFHIGPIAGRTVAVTDTHMQFLVGYGAEPDAVTWFGCEAGYAALALLKPDLPEVHLWEASARGLLPDDVMRDPL
jgi:hypothetical protein